MTLRLTSPPEVAQDVASRARDRRLQANLTQEGLASRAGVSLGTLKLFERTGKASFETVVRIAFALEAEGEFERLFPRTTPRTIEDIMTGPKRQRGRRS